MEMLDLILFGSIQLFHEVDHVTPLRSSLPLGVLSAPPTQVPADLMALPTLFTVSENNQALLCAIQKWTENV